ncbi:TPA: hypothetical protein NV716_002916 [Escherichia coli]|nr:hypothetical protein [Escherichia coli]
MIKTIFCFLILMVTSFSSVAYDGNDLFEASKVYQANTKTDDLTIGYYMGYVAATSGYAADNGVFCSPSNTRNGQLFDIVYNHLKENPASRSYSASTVIEKALSEAYLCSRKAK